MQQNPSPQPEDVGRHATKSKRPRPFGIEVRRRMFWNKGVWTEWAVYKRYRTERERDDALDKLRHKDRSLPWEYRAMADE